MPIYIIAGHCAECGDEADVLVDGYCLGCLAEMRQAMMESGIVVGVDRGSKDGDCIAIARRSDSGVVDILFSGRPDELKQRRGRFWDKMKRWVGGADEA